eukprot:TRINITY_DN5557_c0_g1_i1.p1 TRINITY_DN5557_c0_g1~~TRINITY_DN5557_c0_g1_i1.p1  ORF type:complete len:587 (-),score=157.29 TRINITY_DN5557_c0_g1_i1:73-1833(-)
MMSSTAAAASKQQRWASSRPMASSTSGISTTAYLLSFRTTTARANTVAGPPMPQSPTPGAATPPATPPTAAVAPLAQAQPCVTNLVEAAAVQVLSTFAAECECLRAGFHNLASTLEHDIPEGYVDVAPVKHYEALLQDLCSVVKTVAHNQDLALLNICFMKLSGIGPAQCAEVFHVVAQVFSSKHMSAVQDLFHQVKLAASKFIGEFKILQSLFPNYTKTSEMFATWNPDQLLLNLPSNSGLAKMDGMSTSVVNQLTGDMLAILTAITKSADACSIHHAGQQLSSNYYVSNLHKEFITFSATVANCVKQLKALVSCGITWPDVAAPIYDAVMCISSPAWYSYCLSLSVKVPSEFEYLLTVNRNFFRCSAVFARAVEQFPDYRALEGLAESSQLVPRLFAVEQLRHASFVLSEWTEFCGKIENQPFWNGYQMNERCIDSDEFSIKVAKGPQQRDFNLYLYYYGEEAPTRIVFWTVRKMPRQQSSPSATWSPTPFRCLTCQADRCRHGHASNVWECHFRTDNCCHDGLIALINDDRHVVSWVQHNHFENFHLCPHMTAADIDTELNKLVLWPLLTNPANHHYSSGGLT